MKKPRSLSRLKNKAVGPVHRIEVHPAKNGRGGRGFITHTFRRHPDAGKPAPPGTGLGYMPPPPPEEAVHEDQPSMIDHVGRMAGVPASADTGGDDEDEEE
jgi:hypothetical protein